MICCPLLNGLGVYGPAGPHLPTHEFPPKNQAPRLGPAEAKALGSDGKRNFGSSLHNPPELKTFSISPNVHGNATCITQGEMAQKPAVERRNWLWLGADWGSILARASRGETAAKQEIDARLALREEEDGLFRLNAESYLSLLRSWFATFRPNDPEMQRVLRRIRRNRRRAPKLSDVVPLLLSHKPAWPVQARWEAIVLIHLSPSRRPIKAPSFSSTLPKNRRGRPRRGVPVQAITAAKRVLSEMIRDMRAGALYQLDNEEIRRLRACGIFLHYASKGPLEERDVSRPYAATEKGVPLWFAVPRQRRLFWRFVVAKSMRADAAARDFLHTELQEAVREGLRRRSRRLDPREAHRRAQAWEHAAAEVSKAMAEGKEPAEDHLRVFCSELGS